MPLPWGLGAAAAGFICGAPACPEAGAGAAALPWGLGAPAPACGGAGPPAIFGGGILAAAGPYSADCTMSGVSWRPLCATVTSRSALKNSGRPRKPVLL